jgi:hypothetical protein
MDEETEEVFEMLNDIIERVEDFLSSVKAEEEGFTQHQVDTITEMHGLNNKL